LRALITLSNGSRTTWTGCWWKRWNRCACSTLPVQVVFASWLTKSAPSSFFNVDALLRW